MARRQDDGVAENERLIDRRSVLQFVGGSAAAIGAVGLSGRASGQQTETVDLGKQGLSSGDLIDPYLDQHFTSGTEVQIPAGEYNYTGAGLGGTKSNCALVGSPDGVIFNRPDDPEQTVRPDIFAASGTVRIENITIKGKRGQAQSRWRVGAASDARMEVVNVNHPDGTVEGSDSTGIYAGTDHAGLLWVRNCYFSNFGNVALYVSDPYKGSNGQVIVEQCAFVNTGMSALRFASDNSIARGCYFEATEEAPSGPSGRNQRGIKIDDPGTDVVIEDCDFLWGSPGTSAINFDDEGEGGGGVIKDVRMQKTGESTLFRTEWDVEGSWTGENIHLTEA